MKITKTKMSLLLERPNEPIFFPRQNLTFEVPDNFLKERYVPIKSALKKRFESDPNMTVRVRNTTVPDLSVPLRLRKNENFSLFIPHHRVIAGRLLDIFVEARDIDDLLSIATYSHDRLNSALFNYALSVALLHRKDTKGIQIPNIIQTFPWKFFDGNTYNKARKEAIVVPEENRKPIEMEKFSTASDLEPEQRVAYFREDIGINLHHWHWHLVYPSYALDQNLVAKDRRGELFYYMHQQILARYDSARLCNDLPPVNALKDLRQPITEAYFSKLQTQITSRTWPPRFCDMMIQDINRPDDHTVYKVEDVEMWIQNIKNAIEDGYLMDSNGNRIPIMHRGGIDILGNVIESNSLSSNPDFYGDCHNIGHMLIAFCHDPNNKYLEPFSVMGDTATAVRDPVFYRWHKYINDILEIHKDKLPSYSVDELEFQGVKVTDLEVIIENDYPNTFRTFWEKSEIDLSRGLDFTPQGKTFVHFTHLQHKPFSYKIFVENKNHKHVVGTVRIFLAPLLDEHGSAMDFNTQRHFMMEMDKFKVSLKEGTNKITRKSEESSVTISYENSFRNLDQSRPKDPTEERNFNFCGCGWPQHMLIPKGTEQGALYQLFLMISNNQNDRIIQDLEDSIFDAESYCGIQDKKYPDKQSMGFPFDRVPRDGIAKLSDFVMSNMRIQDVVISFSNVTVSRKEQFPYYHVVNAQSYEKN